MQVSRTSVFGAREILISGQQDIIQLVEQGRMSIHAALKAVRARNNSVSEEYQPWKQLLSDWRRLTRNIEAMNDSDRLRAIQLVKETVDDFAAEQSSL